MAMPPTQPGRIARRAFLVSGAAAALMLRRDRAIDTAPRGASLAQVELEQAARKVELCSSANAAGVGLRGEYFPEEGCRGVPLLVRLDSSIDFDASLDWPPDRAGERPLSVRWSGWIKPALAGRYRFHAGADHARVLVARQPMAGAGADAQAQIELAAGRYYPITVELDRIAGANNRIRLEWTAPHGARFAVPRALLYLPTDAVPARRA
ncbi:PA14 domain-containing protein [Piscinibacter sp. XHJ-5]|uniref:PA14 domain-containing protein n=1 Tax=Piscinibacter sp. XHJ-5 TaxID=3037797 RepID=UPI002452FEED|nr:PA14 domain-containing protein [Piscinibacter sp. XHJ-5]